MSLPLSKMQPVLAYVAGNLDDNIPLAALAAQVGLSPFHLHRVFSAAVGETPKQLTLRLRLGRAAVLLLTSDDSVLDVALSCGFQSHEAFTRAFRRRFGMTPTAYRARGFVNDVDTTQASDHAALVDKVGPCVGLYHVSGRVSFEGNEMTYSITKKELAPQPVLVVRRKVKRSEIASTIAQVLPQVFLYAQQNGIALAGQPFTRYLEMGPGLVTMQLGMRVAASGQDPKRIEAAGEVVPGTLPGGPVATTVHAGPYEKLTDAYAAIEQWMEAEGLVAAGAPWECYVTDPADYPDPQDWKTEVFWPLAH